MKYGLIYDSTYCHITCQYLRDCIPNGDCVRFDFGILKSNAEMKQLLETAAQQGDMPDVLLFEVCCPGLPRGLTNAPIPTACLDVDTFGWTDFRLKWAMLFDCVFTWHPSCVPLFQDAGHPNVHALPHAVDARFYSGADAQAERPYEIGFVGNFGLPQYIIRDRVNLVLVRRFRTNDFQKRYTKEETAKVYERSKIVVNVSRSEFPSEANMRCYEAMAAGALLMTEMPTELTEWGFREGEHFVGWRSEEEIPRLVQEFLQNDGVRAKIAQAGQVRTLEGFTFQKCMETINRVMAGNHERLLAPARHWSDEAIHLLYLNYYHRFQLSGAALAEFRLLRKAGTRAYWKGLPTALKSLRHAMKSSLM